MKRVRNDLSIGFIFTEKGIPPFTPEEESDTLTSHSTDRYGNQWCTRNYPYNVIRTFSWTTLLQHFFFFLAQVGSPYTVPISRVVDGLRESGVGGKILSDALTLGGTRRGEEQGRRATMDWEGPLTLEVLQVRSSRCNNNNNSKEQQQYWQALLPKLPWCRR